MDFNAQQKVKVLAFMPISKIGSTNIILNKNTLVKMCYLTTASNVTFISNYLMVTLDDNELDSFINALKTANSVKGLLQGNGADLINFAEEQRSIGTPLSIVVPITLNDNQDQTTFGSIMKASKFYENDYAILEISNNENSGFFSFPMNNIKVVINGRELESVCELCKLNSQRSGGECIYKSDTFDCLFNCALDNNITEIKPSVSIPQESLAFKIDIFERVEATDDFKLDSNNMDFEGETNE